VALERPQIGKPEGDIPFELGIEDIVVGDGDEARRCRKFGFARSEQNRLIPGWAVGRCPPRDIGSRLVGCDASNRTRDL